MAYYFSKNIKKRYRVSKNSKMLLLPENLQSNLLYYPIYYLEKNDRFGSIFSSMEANNTFTGCPKEKFDNLAVKSQISFFIPHMPTEISQGLSKNKYIFLIGYFGYRTRYPKHIFHWTPCKTEILDKKLKCVNFIRINDYFGV